MRTLYESILDIENTISAGDEAAIRYWYQRGLHPYGIDGKYDFKKNKLISKGGWIFITGENGGVQVKTHKEVDKSIQQDYVNLSEYDSRQAEFNCGLFVDFTAIKNGFKYGMINHTGNSLKIYSVISILWDSNLLLPFLNKKMNKGVEVDISGLIDEKVAQNNIWKDASVVKLSYSPVIGNPPDIMGFKNIAIKKLCILGTADLFHMARTPRTFNDLSNPFVVGSASNIPDAPLKRIKTFLTNNPQTILYLAMGGAFVCKIELVNGEFKHSNMKFSNITKD